MSAEAQCRVHGIRRCTICLPPEPTGRHTRTGHLANQLHDGTLFVGGEWYQSARPPGRHRCDCPPDPMGFDCPHTEHREGLR